MPRWDDPPEEADFQPEVAVDADSLSQDETALFHYTQHSSLFRKNNPALKVGILGGKGVGKSYLLQAMIHRIADRQRAGSLSYYLKDCGLELSMAELFRQHRVVDVPSFLRHFRRMDLLPPTFQAGQYFYLLRLRFPRGILGKGGSMIEFECLDGSGEVLEIGAHLPEYRQLWYRAFGDAAIILFCLPLWVLFPDYREMRDADWALRDEFLAGFSRITATYQEIRNPGAKVRSVLALTMADDRKSALQTLYRRWIKPCIEAGSISEANETLGRASNLMQYLESAHQISEYLWRKINQLGLTKLAGFSHLDTGYGAPWIIPVSSVNGRKLERITTLKQRRNFEYKGPPPSPAHVELPLLLALCEHLNVLM